MPAAEAEIHEDIGEEISEHEESDYHEESDDDIKIDDIIDKSTFKVAINEDHIPLSDIEGIFGAITDTAWKNGLKDCLSHIGGRNLRVGTMCSGTESPILALQMINEGNMPLDSR